LNFSIHANVYLGICNIVGYFALIKLQYQYLTWTLTTLPHTILLY